MYTNILTHLYIFESIIIIHVKFNSKVLKIFMNIHALIFDH